MLTVCMCVLGGGWLLSAAGRSGQPCGPLPVQAGRRPLTEGPRKMGAGRCDLVLAVGEKKWLLWEGGGRQSIRQRAAQPYIVHHGRGGRRDGRGRAKSKQHLERIYERTTKVRRAVFLCPPSLVRSQTPGRWRLLQPCPFLPSSYHMHDLLLRLTIRIENAPLLLPSLSRVRSCCTYLLPPPSQSVV